MNKEHKWKDIYDLQRYVFVKEPTWWYCRNSILVQFRIRRYWDEEKFQKTHNKKVTNERFNVSVYFLSIDDFYTVRYYNFTKEDGDVQKIIESMKKKYWDNLPYLISISWLEKNGFKFY